MNEIIIGAITTLGILILLGEVVGIRAHIQAKEVKEKNKSEQPQKPVRCKHVWRPFPWYTKWEKEDDLVIIEVFKPYVCIHCKEEKHVKLRRMQRRCTKDNVMDIIAGVEEVYRDKIQPIAIVREQIADMQLIDPVALRIARDIGKWGSSSDHGFENAVQKKEY